MFMSFVVVVVPTNKQLHVSHASRPLGIETLSTPRHRPGHAGPAEQIQLDPDGLMHRQCIGASTHCLDQPGLESIEIDLRRTMRVAPTTPTVKPLSLLLLLLRSFDLASIHPS